MFDNEGYRQTFTMLTQYLIEVLISYNPEFITLGFAVDING